MVARIAGVTGVGFFEIAGFQWVIVFRAHRACHPVKNVGKPFRSKAYFGNDPISPEARTRMLKGLFRSFPDWFMVINEIISADNEAVVGLITGRGTQYEEFTGRPPRDPLAWAMSLWATRRGAGRRRAGPGAC